MNTFHCHCQNYVANHERIPQSWVYHCMKRKEKEKDERERKDKKREEKKEVREKAL